jgi:post-segregation antitoxin (ccd killing protein)
MTNQKIHNQNAARNADLTEISQSYGVFFSNEWRRANAQAIESSNAYVNKNGLPLAKYRLKLTK